MALALDAWIDTMRDEYFASYIPDGGSAVRFVVAPSSERVDEAHRRLRSLGEAAGLTVVLADCATIRLNQLQNLFFCISQAIDWDRLLQARLEAIVADSGYQWPTPGQRSSLAVIAERNGVAPGLMRKQISQDITRAVWHDARLCQDFRNAMIALLDARLADDRDVLRDAILDWLRGGLRRVSAVRGAQIMSKINRNNARSLLMSLCHWLRVSGQNGILLLIDMTALLRERRDLQSGHHYTPAAVMDCYEVLRQMIDDADEMEAIFIGVLADSALLSDDSRRSLNRYTALKMRVWDDVRPEHGENPLAPLVVMQ